MNSENIVIYKALGFPIKVVNPKFIEFRGEKVLDINPKKLMKAAFKAVISKPTRLSGSEVKFLRGYMELSQKSFADLIGVERSLISKWETLKDAFTGMDVPKEIVLRAQCAFFLNQDASFKKEFFDQMIGHFSRTEEVGEPIEIRAPAA